MRLVPTTTLTSVVRAVSNGGDVKPSVTWTFFVGIVAFGAVAALAALVFGKAVDAGRAWKRGRHPYV